MKKIFLTTIICLICAIPSATAQNKIFSKYADMDDVEYICITKAMLKLLGNASGSATINGVKIDGISNAIEIVLIINSNNAEVQETMRKDFAKLKKDRFYATLMEAKSNGERVSTLINAENEIKEVVMYIDNGEKEQVFIVLTGRFTSQQLSEMLKNN